ncbi:MAG: SUMF1/EgtB/PvdO family nonheme iron enzyme, partial [Candidatus Latescibacterota bacterium]|nr:SUMF1/EgtB/PvdO family nonheme iron enzyme [Candidatus Latescibacterota bacterium]
VNCVSWYDAARYCDWVGGRLPTEAEWELVGRGEGGRQFPWFEGGVNCERAVVGYGLGCGEQSTWPVGSLPSGDSPYGVSDLVGNVWEWTLASYESNAYSRLGDFDPVNLLLSDRKVLRGNSWYYSDPPLDSRLTNRYAFAPYRFYPYIGFRCVFPGTDDAIQFELAFGVTHEPSVEIVSQNWMDRNLSARLAEGEAPFDIAPKRQEMIVIPNGQFEMGSSNGQHDERPARVVYVDAYQIDRYEVSVAAFSDCVDAGGCEEPYSGGSVFPKQWEWQNCNWGIEERASHPVNCVDWFEASAYCSWAGKRLPTEAEWEKAARGEDGRPYPWGETQPDCDRAVIDSGGDGCGRETTWPVGSKPDGASPYGVEDMSGNVWEWVDDWYAYDYYTWAPDRNPRNTQEETMARQPGWGGGKILRGGSWADQATSIHSAANRLGYPEDTHPDYTIGFRCAQDLMP